MVKVWVDEYDVGAPNLGGYTDAKWRAECDDKWLEYKKRKAQEDSEKEYWDKITTEKNSPKAKQRQIGGDHYKNMGVEPWDVVDTWPIEQRIGAYRHGALKYLMRCGRKDGRLQEIKKAGHYIEKLIEILQEEYPDADTGTT